MARTIDRKKPDSAAVRARPKRGRRPHLQALTTGRAALGAMALLLFCSAAPAHATQVCAWMKETIKSGDVHNFELWLQSDGEAAFLYKTGGKGLVTATMTANSPASATYTLQAGQAEKVWEYGSTMDPPGIIDFNIELHQWPADIFSDAPTPLMAKFVFQRDVPKAEKQAPATLAKKQCAVLENTN